MGKKRKEDPARRLPDGLSVRGEAAVKLTPEGGPVTLDEATRSVGVIAASENPVAVWDYERWEVVDEVLLMSGCVIPDSRQVPLLDSHWRGSTESVLGSCRELAIEDGLLVGRVHYSEAEEAEGPWMKVREGHLTDYSVGYRVLEAVWVPEGESAVIAGRRFEGPVKVATSWRVSELSTCPIGADEAAKARAEASAGIRGGNNQTEAEPETREDEMDKRLRAYLERRGLAAEASEEDAWAFLGELEDEGRQDPPDAGGGGVPAADPVRREDEIRAEERQRCGEIRAMADHFGFGDLGEEMVEAGRTVTEAREKIMEAVMKKGDTEGGVGFRAEFGADERDKFRAAGVDALQIRSGNTIEAPAAGADDLAGYGLRELAREALRVAGQPTGGNILEMVGRALTTSDFPLILADSANKSLLAGWEDAEETWDQWCGIGSVSDFKTHKAVRAGETEDLDEIGEDDEYKYGSRSEAQEQYAVATYGKLFKIGRQTIINDDLGALNDIPYQHGLAAARKVGDIAYATLTANSAMGDAIALFHGSHGNLGTGGVPSETTLAEAIKLMGLQKDIAGRRRLNISPRFFLAPKSLEGVAEVFFNSNQFAGSDTGATRANPYAGNKYQRIYESRLDDDSAAAWYMAAARGKTVKVFFLNGQRRPYMETRQGWNVDGTEMKVRIDAGAKAMDWRGLLKNAGE